MRTYRTYRVRTRSEAIHHLDILVGTFHVANNEDNLHWGHKFLWYKLNYDLLKWRKQEHKEHTSIHGRSWLVKEKEREREIKDDEWIKRHDCKERKGSLTTWQESQETASMASQRTESRSLQRKKANQISPSTEENWTKEWRMEREVDKWKKQNRITRVSEAVG